MSTQSQILANRANSQKSTGPTSPEGKARSAQNALKTGIDSEALLMPGEDPAALESLKSEYYAAHQPATPEARLLLDTLIKNEWLLRRFDRIESQLWANEARRLEEPHHKPFRAARSYAAIDKHLARLQTRINAAQRNFQRALKDLQTVEKLVAAQQNLQQQLQKNQRATAPEPAEINSPERTQSAPQPHPPQPQSAPHVPAQPDLKCA